MEINSPAKVKVAHSIIENAGRGIVATDNILEGELIERCPIIFLTENDYPLAKQTSLLNYYFLNESEDRAAIALGYGSLYNHSFEPNATYNKFLEEGFIDFVAIKNIKAGVEVTVNYNYGNPDDKKKLWISEIPEYQSNDEYKN